MGQKVDSAYQNAQDAKESSIQAVIAANGKNTVYDNIDGEENLPQKANEGDLAFVQTGDGKAMYVYTKMPDGSFKWVKHLDPDTGKQIAAGVDDAIKQAKSQAAAMDEVRASEAAVFQSEANAALSSGTAERAAFSSSATSMANSAASRASSMANSAAAYGKAQADDALSSANKALDDAKTELTTAIGKETSDRNKAVSAANSQAHDYAEAAKSDAIEAARTADGVVRKQITDTAEAIGVTISQNKSDADEGISTAQASATAALDGLKTKVSQDEYDEKTQDLTTKVNTASQTATETKNELADITKTVGSQSAKINTISDTAEGTKQTVSDIQTEQGKQSGSINQLEARADGFDAKIQTIDDLVNAQGQINQLFNTEFTPDLEGWSASNSDITYAGISKSVTVKGSNVLNITHGANTNWSRYSQQISDFVVGGTLSASVYARATSTGWGFAIDSFSADGTRTIVKQVTITTTNTLLKIENVTIPSDASKLYFSFWGNTAGTAVVYKPMLVFDSTVGSYIQGAYNNNGALAKVKLTAEQASLDLEKYKTDADGRISKAQADIIATANEVTNKVSQSDYDKKTQDLDNKYGQVKVTADAVTNEVAKYKIDNDKKVSANTAGINTLSGLIDSKVSQTDYDTVTGELRGKYSEQQQTINGMSDIVTELQTKANAQGQINQLLNTEFTPDLQGWDSSETSSGVKTPYRQYIFQGSNMLTFDTRNQPDKKYSSIKQTIPFATSGSNRVVSLSWWSRIAQGTDLYGSTHIRSYDASMTKLTDVAKNWDNSSSMTLQKFENVAIPDEARFVEITFAVREGYLAFLAKPMFVYRSTVGTYVQGVYNNNARVAALEIGITGITGLVNDPSKGLSATWSLASNGQTVAIKAQKDAKTAGDDATIALTTAQGLQTTVQHVQDDVETLTQQTVTADQFTIEVQNRKDGDDNTLSVSKQYTIDQINDASDGFQSIVEQSAKGIYINVSMPNKLFNTEFTPNLDGWLSNSSLITNVNLNNSTIVNGSNALDIVHGSTTGWARYSQKVTSFNVGSVLSASLYAKATSTGWGFAIDSYNSSGTRTIIKQVTIPTTNTLLKIENVTIPSDAAELHFSIWGNTAGTATISQPMLVFNSTVGPYMTGSYSSVSSDQVVQTSMLVSQTFFGVNLANSSGDIITSINADSSGVSITGKHLTLDGNVTVTGDFYAKGGNFKNLNASNITAGTLNAANLKVINLDVSSLTGELTNFVKSNWEGAYGEEVSIQSDHITFYTNAWRSFTTISEGKMDMTVYNDTTSTSEHIGGFGHYLNDGIVNQNMLTIYLDGYQATPSVDHPVHGGDGFSVAITNGKNLGSEVTDLLAWESALIANSRNHHRGWHFYDRAYFNSNVFGEAGAQMALGKINGSGSLSIGNNMTGIAGDTYDMYLYNQNGYISLNDLATKLGLTLKSYTWNGHWEQ